MGRLVLGFKFPAPGTCWQEWAAPGGSLRQCLPHAGLASPQPSLGCGPSCSPCLTSNSPRAASLNLHPGSRCPNLPRAILPCHSHALPGNLTSWAGLALGLGMASCVSLLTWCELSAQRKGTKS